MVNSHYISRLMHDLKISLQTNKHQNAVCNIEYPVPKLDLDYICNEKNRNLIENNIKSRRCEGNIAKVLELSSRISKKCHKNLHLDHELQKEILKIPNKSYPLLAKYGDEPRIIKMIGIKKEFDHRPREFSMMNKHFRILRNEKISNLTGHRSYYTMDPLAKLEEALTRYALKELKMKQFNLISVPDILNRAIIEGCGMNTRGERTQVYSLDCEHYGPDLCLSGTAEMGIAGYIMNKNIPAVDLPKRLAAISRCYRAEASRTAEEKGIYRVHQFTKVEMFGVSRPEGSDDLLEEFRSLAEDLFAKLGLHLRTLDMPLAELGPQAYRKYDIEAWMPGRGVYGELSSCSNCTDYQARRLNIRSGDGFVHTVNGTACAVPRLLIALLETHQQPDLSIHIPAPLRPYFNNEASIKQPSQVPVLKTINPKHFIT